MGFFGKLKSGITFPFRKAGIGVRGAGRAVGRATIKVVSKAGGSLMTNFFSSKTILTAIGTFLLSAVAAFLGDPEFQAMVQGAVPWLLPILMIVLRMITKTPIK